LFVTSRLNTLGRNGSSESRVLIRVALPTCFVFNGRPWILWWRTDVAGRKHLDDAYIRTLLTGPIRKARSYPRNWTVRPVVGRIIFDFDNDTRPGRYENDTTRRAHVYCSVRAPRTIPSSFFPRTERGNFSVDNFAGRSAPATPAGN